jgi:hypothetical protein
MLQHSLNFRPLLRISLDLPHSASLIRYIFHDCDDTLNTSQSDELWADLPSWTSLPTQKKSVLASPPQEQSICSLSRQQPNK